MGFSWSSAKKVQLLFGHVTGYSRRETFLCRMASNCAFMLWPEYLCSTNDYQYLVALKDATYGGGYNMFGVDSSEPSIFHIEYIFLHNIYKNFNKN